MVQVRLNSHNFRQAPDKKLTRLPSVNRNFVLNNEQNPCLNCGLRLRQCSLKLKPLRVSIVKSWQIVRGGENSASGDKPIDLFSWLPARLLIFQIEIVFAYDYFNVLLQALGSRHSSLDQVYGCNSADDRPKCSGKCRKCSCGNNSCLLYTSPSPRD